MSPEQQAAIRARAYSDPTCAKALANRDLDALAEILSIGRTRPSALEVGNGTIIETIGIESGNRLLDAINGDPSMRYVKPLLEQGRLRVGSPVAQAAIRAFASAGVITPDEASKLCALGLEPDLLGRLDVEAALFNSDGSKK